MAASSSRAPLGQTSADNTPASASASSKPSASAASSTAAEPVFSKLSASDFAIGKQLGSGRYGRVFRVKHLLTNKVMVMKVINKAEVSRDGVVHQLRREVEIHSRCKHSNIVECFCYFSDDERVYLVLEYCNGRTLLDKIRKSGRLSEEQTRGYLQQLVAALTYLREGKAVPIIHRDIKPENILFQKDKTTKKETLKLADFGWAVQHVPTSMRLTLCGTPEYLPPEVVDSERHSGGFDIWTLGVLMYEMLAGCTPFDVTEDEIEEGEDKVDAIMRKVSEVKSIPVPSHFSEVAADLVLRMLDRSPDTRILLEDIAKHPFLAPGVAAAADACA